MLQLLSGFGVILVFGGVLFALEGSWHSYQQYVQRNVWPATQARVRGCSLAGVWEYTGSPNTRNVWGKSSWVSCALEYNGGGSIHQVTVQVGRQIFVPLGARMYPSPEARLNSMKAWIGRHSPGSVIAAHYDPAHPEILSLAGEDTDLNPVTPSAELLFGLSTGIAGFLIVKTGKRLSRQAQSAKSATSPL